MRQQFGEQCLIHVSTRGNQTVGVIFHRAARCAFHRIVHQQIAGTRIERKGIVRRVRRQKGYVCDAADILQRAMDVGIGK